MRFNAEETELILAILHPLMQQEQVTLIAEMLQNGAYVRGRNLNFLFAELNKPSVVVATEKQAEMQQLLKRIKFKATPR